MKSQAQQAMDAGLLCEKSGNFAEAEQHYLSALRKKKNALAHIRLGRLYVKQQAWAQGLPHFVAACELAPERARYHFELARCAEQVGDSELALEHFQKAIALAPEEGETYFALAGLLERLHHADAARVIYQQATAAYAIAERTERHFSLLNWAKALEQTGFGWDAMLLLLDKWPATPGKNDISCFLHLLQRLGEEYQIERLMAELGQRGWLEAPAEWLQPALLKLALTFTCFEPGIVQLMTRLQQQPHLPVATEALLLELLFVWQGMTPELLSRAIRLLDKPRGYSRLRALNLATWLFHINDISRLNSLCQRYPELLEFHAENLGVALVTVNRRVGGEKEEQAQRALKAFELLKKESSAFWISLVKDEESLAVVGNSACESGRGRGASIDRHRNVVRFNQFSVAPEFAPDYGRRTTIHVRPASARQRNMADETFFSTPDDAKVIVLSSFRLFERSNQWQQIARMQESGKQVVCFPAEVQQKLLQQLGRQPSSGLTMIEALRKHAPAGKTINYFGFAFTDQLQPESRAHYFAKTRPLGKHGWLKEAEYFTQLTGVKLPTVAQEQRLPLCLLGDHSTLHAGSAAVVSYLKQELAQVAYPERHDYQLLLVNGEDTLHHDGRYFQYKLLMMASAIGRRKKVALINALWQANSSFFDFMLPYVDYMAVRDPLSQKELQEQHGVASRLYLDLAYWQEINEDVGALDVKQAVVTTDYQKRDDGQFVRFTQPQLARVPFMDLRTLEWSTLVKTLRTASLLVTGRLHGALAACRARIPFIAIKGNTHELDGFIAMSGLPIPLCSSEEEIPKAIEWALANQDVYQRLFDYLDSLPRWQFAEVTDLLFSTSEPEDHHPDNGADLAEVIGDLEPKKEKSTDDDSGIDSQVDAGVRLREMALVS